MAERQLRCHRCGSPDLILREAHYEWGEWSDGLYVREDGTIGASGEAIFNPGDPDPKRTEIECGSCGHSWHPRREFTGTLDR